MGWLWSLVMSKTVRNKCLVFSGTTGKCANLFADLNRVVIIGSRGVGKRMWRQDEGCRSDVKNLRESCLFACFKSFALSVLLKRCWVRVCVCVYVRVCELLSLMFLLLQRTASVVSSAMWYAGVATNRPADRCVGITRVSWSSENLKTIQVVEELVPARSTKAVPASGVSM